MKTVHALPHVEEHVGEVVLYTHVKDAEQSLALVQGHLRCVHPVSKRRWDHHHKDPKLDSEEGILQVELPWQHLVC